MAQAAFKSCIKASKHELCLRAFQEVIVLILKRWFSAFAALLSSSPREKRIYEHWGYLRSKQTFKQDHTCVNRDSDHVYGLPSAPQLSFCFIYGHTFNVLKCHFTKFWEASTSTSLWFTAEIFDWVICWDAEYIKRGADLTYVIDFIYITFALERLQAFLLQKKEKKNK